MGKKIVPKPQVLFKTTTITFANGLKGQHFRQDMYKNICPLAAKQMQEMYRCQNAQGQCVEYQKFANAASFKTYTKYAWMPTLRMVDWYESGSHASAYIDLTEKQFKDATSGLGCVKVEPQGDPTVSSAVYKTTTITFSRGAKGREFKQYMY